MVRHFGLRLAPDLPTGSLPTGQVAALSSSAQPRRTWWPHRPLTAHRTVVSTEGRGLRTSKGRAPRRKRESDPQPAFPHGTPQRQIVDAWSVDPETRLA